MNIAYRDRHRGSFTGIIAPVPATGISLSYPLTGKCGKEQHLRTVTPPKMTAFDIRRCFFRIFYDNEEYEFGHDTGPT